MPIQFVSGDLFANRFKAKALAHGCNCQGSMGAGIATGFRDRYPEMFAEYRRRCKAEPREFNLGDAFLWKESASPGCSTSARRRASGGHGPATRPSKRPWQSMRRQADREGVASIAVPRIGAGYGGLSWKKVRAVIEKVFADWPGTLYVYEEYAPEEDGPDRPTAKEVTMPIAVESRRKKRATIEKTWPGALILDVTSKGEEPWVRFSPFYPHGGIPVPNSPGVFARSVEGLWQGLKVFENEGIDPSSWEITDMKGIKRAGRRQAGQGAGPPLRRRQRRAARLPGRPLPNLPAGLPLGAGEPPGGGGEAAAG